MTTARYIIVLDRYDDDDYLREDTNDGKNDGTEIGGCEQVAAELQEAMDEIGEPAGFFRVIAREVYEDEPPATTEHATSTEEIVRDVSAMLQRDRRQNR